MTTRRARTFAMTLAVASAALGLPACPGEIDALFPCETGTTCACDGGEAGTPWCGSDGVVEHCACGSSADVEPDEADESPSDAPTDPEEATPTDGDVECDGVRSDPFDDGILDPCWQTATIGEGLPGSAHETRASLVVTANGTDIYRSADEFFFVYRQGCGDIDVTLTVNYVPDMDDWSRSGLMIRENLTPLSKYAAALVTDGNGYLFQLQPEPSRRPDVAEGGSFVNAPDNPEPGHVRLVRSGDNFTALYSDDGSTWTELGDSLELAMQACVYVGIATCSHTTDSVGTASYNDFTVLSGGAGS